MIDRNRGKSAVNPANCTIVTGDGKVRVLICDDAVMYATLLSHWFADDPQIEVIGTVASAPQALEQAQELQPDVILLDHRLRDVLSTELAPQLLERVPDAGIVLVSGLPPGALAEVAEEIGAPAWVSKASTQAAVREGILAASVV